MSWVTYVLTLAEAKSKQYTKGNSKQGMLFHLSRSNQTCWFMVEELYCTQFQNSFFLGVAQFAPALIDQIYIEYAASVHLKSFILFLSYKHFVHN